MSVSKDLRDAAILLAVSVLVGWANVKLRTDLPLIAKAPPPEDTACGSEDLPDFAHPRTSVQQLRELVEKNEQPFAIVDARSPEAYLAGHIPGAISLPAHAAPELLSVQSLPMSPQQKIVTYCDGGECSVSESLAVILRQDAGCTEVWVLEGGFAAWLEAKAPVLRGPEPGLWPRPASAQAAPPTPAKQEIQP